jgi:hypothetical protein
VNRKLLIVVIATLLLLISVGGMFFLYTRGRQEREQLRQAEAREEAGPAPGLLTPPPTDTSLGTVKVRLYFRSGGSAAGAMAILQPVPRDVPLARDRVTFTRILLEALLKGPGDAGGYRTLPSGTFVRQVFIVDKTAVIDFSRGLAERHPGGILEEVGTIYSIANTVSDNVAGIDSVRILVEGLELPTLAGHVGLNRAFAYSPEFVVGWKPKDSMIQEENLQ